jgi:hypothetical protein
MTKMRLGLAAIIGAVLALGVSLGVEAVASGTTYYACLKGGKLTQVGTTSPTCPAGATVISWDEQGTQGVQGPTGPQGPAGPQGSSDTQYTAGNAWAATVNDGATVDLPQLPFDEMLAVTGAVENGNEGCILTGTLNGVNVSYPILGFQNGGEQGGTIPYPWYIRTDGAVLNCQPSDGSGTVTLSGYLNPLPSQ